LSVKNEIKTKKTFNFLFYSRKCVSGHLYSQCKMSLEYLFILIAEIRIVLFLTFSICLIGLTMPSSNKEAYHTDQDPDEQDFNAGFK